MLSGGEYFQPSAITVANSIANSVVAMNAMKSAVMYLSSDVRMGNLGDWKGDGGGFAPPLA